MRRIAGNEQVQAAVKTYRALAPQEKHLALIQMGFTRSDAERVIMREIRAAAKEALAEFTKSRRRPGKLIQLESSEDDLVVPEGQERQ